MTKDWMAIYSELKDFLNTKDPKRTFNFRGIDAEKFAKLRDDLREQFVEFIIGSEIQIANEWVNTLKQAFREVEKTLGMRGELLPKEFKSFIEEPKRHLMKKIVFYLYDLLRDKISLDEFIKTAGSAVRTSLKTNLRSIYQSWVYVTLLSLLGEKGGSVIYPELRYIILGRSGRQKTGWIPPNLVLYFSSKGCLSFFLEAPRPIGWEDSTDLRKIWTLYTALRPDILVYGGRILNIVQLNSNPPIKRPHVIIECKELEDWYKRGREVRGPFAKPLSVEEWRSKWITGLWDGLADILGVTRSDVVKEVKKRKALRLKDIQIVTLYYTLYKPDSMYLVSRARVPKEVKAYLRARGLKVYDDVGFNKNKLRSLANELYKIAKRSKEDYELLEIDSGAIELVNELETTLSRHGIKLSRRRIIKKILEFALKNKDKLIMDILNEMYSKNI